MSIVPFKPEGSSQSTALIVSGGDAGVPAPTTFEERLKGAEELEAKLKHIQETVPTRVYNVSSSSAGAGSGDFHQYRMVRKAEQERLRKLEADLKKKVENTEHEAKLRELQRQADEKTAKRRAKRMKKKQKKKAKTEPGPGAAEKPSEDASGSDSDDGAPAADDLD